MLTVNLLQSATAFTPALFASGTQTTSFEPPTPLFETAELSFFQSTGIEPLLRAHQGLGQYSYGLHLASNEQCFQEFFPAIQNIGGVLLGVGSLQNLNHAAVAGVSGLILVDKAPNVALSLAMLLPLLPETSGPKEFAALARGLVDPMAQEDIYLHKIPEAFQPAFSDHLGFLRNGFGGAQFQRYVRASQRRPDTILNNQTYFDRIAGMIERQGVGIVYGSIFDPDMPDMVEQAMQRYEDSLRMVYLSNAVERTTTSNNRLSVHGSGLADLLQRPFTDPEGRVLMTTEFGAYPRYPELRQQDGFTYHARRTADVTSWLHESSTYYDWMKFWKDEPRIEVQTDGAAANDSA